MNYKLLIGVLLLITVLFTGTAAADATEIPPLPAQYYGTILIDGKPATVGTTITAQIGNETVGTITTTEPGVFGSSGTFGAKLLVAPASSDAEGKEVIFKTGKSLAQETINFSAGDARKISLNFLSENSLLISLRMPDTILADRTANASVQITSMVPLTACILTLTDQKNKHLWEETINDGSLRWSSTGIPVTLPEGVHTLTLSVENRDKIATSSVSVNAIAYTLEITEDNKAAWNVLYPPDGYNLTAYKGSSAVFGTYYTSNAENVIDYTIDFGENITKIFGAGTENPISGSILAANSSSNLLSCQSPTVSDVGTYPYTITLSYAETNASVSGNLAIVDTMLDIKVLESGTLSRDETSKTIGNLAVYNRADSDKTSRKLDIAVSAGPEGRVLQGLEYLLGYPHECPEQVSSPLLAGLYTKQHYQANGLLNNNLNTTVRSAAKTAINDYLASPNGYDAQHINGVGTNSGGWAWKTSSMPSVLYTAYPMYSIAVLMKDMNTDPDFWTNKNEINLAGIDLNKSTEWLHDHQIRWNSASGYLSMNQYLAVQALNEAYPYLSDDAKTTARTLLSDTAEKLNASRPSSSDTWSSVYHLISLSLANEILQDSSLNTKITEYAEAVNSTAMEEGSLLFDNEYTALAVYGLTLADDNVAPRYTDTVNAGVSALVDSYGTGGRWYSTYTTALAVRALNTAADAENLDGNWQITVKIGDLEQTLIVNATNPANKITLSGVILNDLYGDTPANLYLPITVSKQPGLKTIVSIDSMEKVPKSTVLGYGSFMTEIPAEHIDPLAPENELLLTVPAQGPFPVGEQFVKFTALSKENQDVMILTIFTGEEKKVKFNTTKYGTNGSAAYYEEDSHIVHKYDPNTGTLYVYPGSDNQDEPSLIGGTENTFYVPLEFTGVGSANIEARLAPMSNDMWMAETSADIRIVGTGNLTLHIYSAAGTEYLPGTQEPKIIITNENGDTVDSNRLSEIPEGTYDITIICDGVSAEIPDLDIQAGSIQTYSIYFVQPEPVILTGDTKYTSAQSSSEPEITLIANTVEDGTWSAIVPANVTYQLSPSSLAELRAPEISHANKTITLTEKVNVTKYAGGTASFVAASVAQDGTVTVSGDVSDASLLQVSFIGRPLGDVTGDGTANIIDASAIAQYTVHLKSFDDVSLFYADCIGTGVNIIDASAIAQYTVHLVDEHYRKI